MRKFFSNKFNKEVCEIFAGEYYVTDSSDLILATLLGSCVSVCLRDKVLGISGINHILISNSNKREDIILNQDTRYGINAMEIMINEMMKLGAKRKNLEAKVFGGGKVLNNNLSKIASTNVNFALSYLKIEDIPIKSRDTGGEGGRKIYLFPQDFTVYLKRIEINRLINNKKIKSEEKYYSALQSKKEEEGQLTFF